MKKSINTVLSLIFGIVICGTLLVAGVLAAQNYQANFTLNLSFTPEIVCKIDIGIMEDGDADPAEFYTVYDNQPDAPDVSTANVSSKSRDGDKIVLGLGSTFTDMRIQSAQVFAIKVTNYNSFVLNSTKCIISSTQPNELLGISVPENKSEVCTLNIATNEVQLGTGSPLTNYTIAKTNGTGILYFKVLSNKSIPLIFDLTITD